MNCISGTLKSQWEQNPGNWTNVYSAFLLTCNDIALLNIPQDATPRLKYAPGVDPAKVYLTKTSSKKPARR